MKKIQNTYTSDIDLSLWSKSCAMTVSQIIFPIFTSLWDILHISSDYFLWRIRYPNNSEYYIWWFSKVCTFGKWNFSKKIWWKAHCSNPIFPNSWSWFITTLNIQIGKVVYKPVSKIQERSRVSRSEKEPRKWA